MNNDIDNRSKEELEYAVTLAQHTVYKKYLTELEKYPLVKPGDAFLDENAGDNLRFICMEELTYKKGEDIFQKLSTVYHASMSLGCNLAVMVDVEKIDAPAKIYIGVRNEWEKDSQNLGISFRTLKSGIKSNFPGTIFRDIPSQKEMPELVKNIFFGKGAAKYISSVSCVASIRDKSKTENKSFVQGLERFVDAMRGHTYTAIFLAEPITVDEQISIRNGYENLYSTLSSFRKSVWSYNENESTSVMESLSKGVSKAVTDGTSRTQAHTIHAGVNMGINSSKSNSHTDSYTKTNSITKPSKAAIAGQALSSVGNRIAFIGKIAMLANPVIGSTIIAASKAASFTGNIMKNGTQSQSISNAISDTIGETSGMNGGLNAGYARTVSDGTSHSETETKSETKTESKTKTNGTGKTLQIENTNKSIEEMLKRIEEQLKRSQEGEDYGAYSCGAYFLSGKEDSSILAANTYRALMLGEGSSVENGAINTWNIIDEPEKVTGIKQYLSRFVHPVFALSISKETDNTQDFITYTPGTIVSGLELPLHLGLPTKSVYGLPVIEHAEFGRNVAHKTGFTDSDKDIKRIKIGNIYHMGQIEKKASVNIDVQTLSSHTFITGSTGSGKSNTIYTLLERLTKENVKFLVVEPAKGEYKTILGKRNDVTVYGTNPKLADLKMLHINPFSFPPGIHVLEHMDRLVEIFNVCWPMYAAMPAVLKDAIERSYTVAGWDLVNSTNKYDDTLFPTFTDVLIQIKKVLEESDYSDDNKGDYTGSLVTRIKSLTNGINGLVFTADDISDSQLFDENAVVDLSRVGSSETKALIMGLLVLKLQEHRMQSSKPNEKLHHVTVLEEAHNLLKRTSTEQLADGANMLGKSVEMLANSIAEMRTYGEGFIIADQSPGLLDMSVIRNTNTKIILRLPDFSDRELVGKAAGLDDDQIVELGRLEKGVAAITQSGWLEPVLCKVDKYEEDGETSSYKNKEKPLEKIIPDKEYNDIGQSLLKCIMNKELYRRGDRIDIQKLRKAVIRSKLETVVKCEFIEYITADADRAIESLRKLIYDFLKAGQAIQEARNCEEISDWLNIVVEKLDPSIKGYSSKQIDLVIALIIYEHTIRESSYNGILCKYTELYQEKGGVL